MLTSIVLLVVALAMIYLEFFLPGGLMGTAGALLLLASIVFFAQVSPGLVPLVLFVAAAIVGIIVTIKVALKRVASGDPESSIYLSTDQEGYKSPTFDQSAVGKIGTAATGMGPSGHIEIDGKRHQAVAKTGFIDKGATVEVVGGQSAYLIVKEKKSST